MVCMLDLHRCTYHLLDLVLLHELLQPLDVPLELHTHRLQGWVLCGQLQCRSRPGTSLSLSSA
jgi:hypothetical protein